MKKIIVFILVIFSSFNAKSQLTERIHSFRSLPNNNNDSLHKVANEFTKEVFSSLQSKCVRVAITVRLSALEGWGLELRYDANLVPRDCELAQKHFNRRGALSCNKDKNVSMADAKKRAEEQIKSVEDEFKSKFRNFNLITVSDCTLYKHEWWSVYEIFITEK